MTDLIEAHLRHLRTRAFSPHTINDRRRLLRRLNTDLPFGLDKASTNELEAALDFPEWSVQTRATYLGHLRGYYRWTTRFGHLDWDPSADLDRPRVPAGIPHPVTDEQLAFTLAHAGEPFLTAVVLAAYAGLRVGECAAADREHVTDRTLLVPRGKGGKAAVLPTHPRLWEHVQGRRDGPLMLNRRGARWQADRLSCAVSRHLAAIGLPARVTLHAYRHWFGTMVQRAQGDLRVTQELMRHSSPATTAIYTLITGEQRRSAVQALPDLMNGRRRPDKTAPPAQTTTQQAAA